MDIIKIENLNFSFGNKVFFHNLNLNIKANTWTSIVGDNGSGKTTLLKIILGLIESDCVTIDNLKLNKKNKYEIRKKMGCVFENPNNNLICETVLEELSFPLENMGLSDNEISVRIDNIINLFHFLPDKKREVSELSIDDKQTLALMTSLISSPKILIMDEAFTYVNKATKVKLLNILKNLDITIISVTHDMEETLFADNIVSLENGKVMIHASKEEFFKDKRLDHFPFIIELSSKLKYYDVVDDIAYSYKELVEKIWK